MAKKEKTVVPEIVDSVEALEAKMKAMREAQKVFATFTQEQLWQPTNSVSRLQRWQ